MKEARKIALCSMMAALSVVLMVVGSIAGLGMYAAPMFAGFCLLPIGREVGKKYHLMLWLVVSVLCFILVPNVEQNLMYFALFGCYPIFRPAFERLAKLPRIILKLLFFNVITVSLEILIMLVLVPESLGTAMIIVLLLLGNLTFIVYDFLIPRMERILAYYLKRIIK